MKAIKSCTCFTVLMFMISSTVWAAPKMLLADKSLFDDAQSVTTNHGEYVVPASEDMKHTISLLSKWGLSFVFKDQTEYNQFKQQAGFYETIQKLKNVAMAYVYSPSSSPSSTEVRGMPFSNMVEEINNATGTEIYQTLCGDQLARGWLDNDHHVGIAITVVASENTKDWDPSPPPENCPWWSECKSRCQKDMYWGTRDHYTLITDCNENHWFSLCLCGG